MLPNDRALGSDDIIAPGPLPGPQVLARQGRRTPGYNCVTLTVDLYGGEMVEATAFEPDPVTYRANYYYNAAQNVLYKRVALPMDSKGVVRAWWKAVLT